MTITWPSVGAAQLLAPQVQPCWWLPATESLKGEGQPHKPASARWSITSTVVSHVLHSYLPYRVMEMPFAPTSFLPASHNQMLIMRKIPYESQLTSSWPVLPKTSQYQGQGSPENLSAKRSIGWLDDVECVFLHGNQDQQGKPKRC
jgi:hypothetical protein